MLAAARPGNSPICRQAGLPPPEPPSAAAAASHRAVEACTCLSGLQSGSMAADIVVCRENSLAAQRWQVHAVRSFITSPSCQRSPLALIQRWQTGPETQRLEGERYARARPTPRLPHLVHQMAASASQQPPASRPTLCVVMQLSDGFAGGCIYDLLQLQHPAAAGCSRSALLPAGLLLLPLTPVACPTPLRAASQQTM